MSGVAPRIISATTQHTATVIFLHGLGDTGGGWFPIMKMLAPNLPHVKFVLPTATTRPTGFTGGFAVPSWFDIVKISQTGVHENAREVRDIAALIEEMVQTEVTAGIPENRVVIGGFSQGGASSLYAGFSRTSQTPLGGVIGLSTWLPLMDQLREPANTTVKAQPFFIAHGTDDPVVPLPLGEATWDKLSSLGIPRVSGSALGGLTIKTYPGMDHSADPRELEDLLQWLYRVLPQTT